MDQQAIGLHRQALANAMRQALGTAGMSADEIGHIHAHGLSTQDCDQAEAEAIRDVFGTNRPSVVAAKSYFGNLGAAGGMVELITSLLAMEDGNLFRTLNYETPDPACDIDVVSGEDSVSAGDSVMNLNVTPQGQASAIVVRRDRE